MPLPMRHQVPIEYAGIITEKFTALARRAVKLGLPEPRLTWGARVIGSWAGRDHRVLINVEVDVDVNVRINGWQIIASLDRKVVVGADGKKVAVNTIRSLVGELDEVWRTRHVCDHCQTKRMRNTTVLLRNDADEIKQVGSACLKDFTGHGSADGLIEYAAALAELRAGLEDNGDSCFGGACPGEFEIEEYVARVVSIIREDGWWPKSRAEPAGRPSTAILAWDRCLDTATKKRVWPLEKDDVETAKVAIAWARALEGRTDFDHNLRTLSAGVSVSYRNCGFIAAIPPAFERARGAELARHNAAATSAHVGEVGKKLTSELTLERVVSVEGAYGTTHLHMFKDAAGNALIWRASSERLDVGQYTVTGTVKTHGEYRGVKQTAITRCRAKKVG